MKLCIPVLSDQGMEAQVCDHFGSAPFFIMYDLDAKTRETLINSKADHEHGQCRPMDMLAGKGISAVVCKGMGKNAISAMESHGIKVFMTQSEITRDAVEECMQGKLVKLDGEKGCRQHQCH